MFLKGTISIPKLSLKSLPKPDNVPPVRQNPKLLLRIFRGKNSSEIFQSRILVWTRITRRKFAFPCLIQNYFSSPRENLFWELLRKTGSSFLIESDYALTIRMPTAEFLQSLKNNSGKIDNISRLIRIRQLFCPNQIFLTRNICF